VLLEGPMAIDPHFLALIRSLLALDHHFGHSSANFLLQLLLNELFFF
jgi:hypothetical protein